MNKKKLTRLINDSYNLHGIDVTAKLSDAVKKAGFTYATQSGLSISAADMVVPAQKHAIVEEASEMVKKINNQYWKGLVTDDERYHHTIKIWSRAKGDITTAMVNSFDEDNDIFYMI